MHALVDVEIVSPPPGAVVTVRQTFASVRPRRQTGATSGRRAGERSPAGCWPVVGSVRSSAVPASVARTARWVRPELIAEVAFAEWTHDDTLRRPSYIALWADNDPADVVREA